MEDTKKARKKKAEYERRMENGEEEKKEKGVPPQPNPRGDTSLLNNITIL